MFAFVDKPEDAVVLGAGIIVYSGEVLPIVFHIRILISPSRKIKGRPSLELLLGRDMLGPICTNDSVSHLSPGRNQKGDSMHPP